MTTPTTVRLDLPGAASLRVEGIALDERLGRATLALLPALPPLAPPAGGGDEVDVRGVAVADGRVFWVSAGGRSMRVRECDGTTTIGFGCPPVPGRPRFSGLAATRTGLLVALPDDGLVAEYDLVDGRVRRVWSGLERPGDLAASPEGTAWVTVATGVARLEPGGRSRLVVTAEGVGSLALVVVDDREVLLLAQGEAPGSLRVVTTDGAPVDEPTLPTRTPGRSGSLLVRAAAGQVLIADRRSGAVWLWDLAGGSWLGALSGGPVSVLGAAGGPDGGWWLGDGSTVAVAGPLRWAAHGVVRLGPLPVPPDQDADVRSLVRLRLVGRLDHVTVRTDVAFTRADGLPCALVPGDEAGRAAPDRLLHLPDGAASVEVRVELSDPPPTADDPATRHWLEAVELRFDEAGLVDALPMVYRAQGDPAAFLDPYLRLLASGNDDVVDALVALGEQLDPATATDDLDGDRWLDWLASWVDSPLDDRWPTERRRRVVAEAFVRHGRRGTPQALQDRIALELGVDARVVEPGDLAEVWVLGTPEAELGLTAQLSAAPAGGSVVDVSALVGRSHLIGPADLGAPLFGDLAHRFDVLVDAAAVPDDRLPDLVALVEREKPAHTHAHVCRIEPGIVVGVGGRIGVDLVVGPPPDPLTGLDGFDRPFPLRLGDPAPAPLVLA